MRALVISCTLKAALEPSHTEALAQNVVDELARRGVESDTIRAVDLNIRPGVDTDLGGGDAWPQVHQKILDSEIVIFASPTWAGRPSSVASGSSNGWTRCCRRPTTAGRSPITVSQESW